MKFAVKKVIFLQYVCHMRTNIKYSPDKMWYIAAFVRGMSVDEALKQLKFVLKKGATSVKEVIMEAQEMAVRDHNVEYKSNLWIGKASIRKTYSWFNSQFLFQPNHLSARGECSKVYVVTLVDAVAKLGINIVITSYV